MTEPSFPRTETPVALISDRSGWIHIYVMPVDATSETEARQLTSGNYGPVCRTGRLTANGSHTSTAWMATRWSGFIDIVDVATGRSETVIAESGVNLSPAFSPDGANILYQRTDASELPRSLHRTCPSPGPLGPAERLDAGRAG